MSALGHAAAHSLEPPIAESSVPRCPCQREQPCPCERFAQRLEQRYHEDARVMQSTARTLRALAHVADSDTMRRSLFKIAESLF